MIKKRLYLTLFVTLSIALFQGVSFAQETSKTALQVSSPPNNADVPFLGFDFRGTADALDGIAEIRVIVRDSARDETTVDNKLAYYNPITKEWSYRVRARHLTKDADAWLYVQAKSKSGEFSWLTTIRVHVKETNPTLTIDLPDVIPYEAFELTGTAYNELGIGEIQIKILDKGNDKWRTVNSVADYDSIAGTWTFPVLKEYLTPNNEVKFLARMIDSLGNKYPYQRKYVRVEGDVIVNQAPSVNAGEDIQITTNGIVDFKGVVSDDGLPNPPAELTVRWEKVEGTGEIASLNFDALEISVWFKESGTYVMRLTATDGELTAFDELTVIVSDEPAPPPRPNIESMVRSGKTSITLTWSEVPEADFYKILYKNHWRHENFNLDVGDVTSYELTGLDLDVLYTVSVFGVNDVGEGRRASKRFTLDLNGEPNVPQGIPTIESIVMGENLGAKLTWRKLSDAHSYNIKYHLPGEPDKVIDVGDVTSYEITELETDIIYSFVVSGVNDVGEGRDSGRRGFKLVNEAPVVNAGADMGVALTNVASLKGDITDDGLPKYPIDLVATVLWEKVSGPGEVLFDDAMSAATSATFSEAGSYVLRLTFNDGKLAASDELTVVVSDDPLAPSAPALEPVVISENLGAELTWSEVPEVLFYNVKYGAIPGVYSETIEVGNITSYEVMGLETNTVYYFAVSAVNDVGEGNDSNSEVFVLANEAPEVDAGNDLEVTLPNTASLNATISDDGLPQPAELTSQWEKVSGPSDVTFADATSVSTTAAFSEAGTYELRLTADDSQLSAADEIIITVHAEATVPSTPILEKAVPEDLSVELEWPDIPEAFSYNVKYGTSEDLLDTIIDVGDVTSYVVTGLTNDVTYYFVVSGVNDIGEGEDSNVKMAVPNPYVVTFHGDAHLDSSQKKFGDSSLMLDGDGDYVTVGYKPDLFNILEKLDDSWTIDFWFKPADMTKESIVVQQYEDVDNQWSLVYSPNNGGWHFGWTQNGTVHNDMPQAGVLENNDWVHIAVCKINDKIGLYKNGKQIGFDQLSSDDLAANLGDLYLGHSPATGLFTHGFVDDLHISKANLFGADPQSSNENAIAVPVSLHKTGDYTKVLLPMDVTGLSIYRPVPIDGITFADVRPVMSAVFSTAEDTSINVSSVVITLDDQDISAYADISEDGFSYTPQVDLAEGIHNIKVEVSDNAGSSSQLIWSFEIDITPPPVTIEGVVSGDIVNTDVTPVVTIAEDEGTIESIALNGDPFVSGTAITEEGEYVLGISAKDNVGNVENVDITFVIDKTAPIIVSSFPDDDILLPTQGNDVAISIDFTDNLSGVNQEAIKLFDKDNNDITGQAQVEEGSIVYILNADALVSNEIYTITLYLEDYAGNNFPFEKSFAVDPTIPIVMVTPQGGEFFEPMVVEITCLEEAAIYYSTDGNPPQEGADNTTEVLDGAAEIELSSDTSLIYYAIDVAGNLSKQYPDEAAFETYTFINQAPEVDAGEPIEITLPEMANLSGTATDSGLPKPPGEVTVLWEKVEGPGEVTFESDASLETTASFSEAGTYTLRLIADDSELNAFDDVTVIVNPEPTAPDAPTLEAIVAENGGAKLTWNEVPDTVSYNVKYGIVPGVYSAVVDAGNATSFIVEGLTTNSVYYFVVSAVNAIGEGEDSNFEAFVLVNEDPVVNAGDDFEITLPASADLKGIVTDDDMPNPPAAFTVQWKKVDGPGDVTFADAASAVTTASFSVDGTYVLRLTADDSELNASDEVTVIVYPEPTAPAAPILEAITSGQDTTGTLTWNAVADANFYSVKYGTSLGIYDATIDVGNVMTYTITELAHNIDYYFVVSAINNVGESANSNEETFRFVNLAPIVNAGDDVEITLPASAYLNGTVSDDGIPNPPEAITVQWEKVDGPGDITFIDTTSAITTASFSLDGTYLLRLTADDGELNASDDVMVVVNAEPVLPEEAILEFHGDAHLDASEKKFGASSLLLDGEGDYVSIEDSPNWDILASNTDDWTIDFWVYHTAFYDGIINLPFMQTYITQTEFYSKYWEFGFDGYNVFFKANGAGGKNLIRLIGGDIEETFQWYHLAFCKVGNKFGLYVNGKQVAFQETDVIENYSAALNIGRFGMGSRNFSGYLDEMRMQHSNVFNALPHSGLTDSITVQALPYDADSPTMLLLHFDGENIDASILTAEAKDKSVALQWTETVGADAYLIKYGTQPGKYDTFLSVSSEQTSYIIDGLTNGVMYYFVVATVKGRMASVNSNEEEVIPQVSPPSAPEILSFVSGDFSVELTWNDLPGIVNHTIEYRLIGSPKVNRRVVGDRTSYTIGMLTQNETYEFWLIAENAGGSSISESVTVTVFFQGDLAPPILRDAIPGNGNVVLYWNGVLGAHGYHIKYGTVSGNYDAMIQVGNSSSYEVTDLTDGTRYYFVISASREDKESPNSRELSAVAGKEIYLRMIDYTYDDLNRLENATDEGSTYEFTYDEKGNIMNKKAY